MLKMKLKIALLLVTFCFTTIYSNSQNDINGYKYIIVPKKFDFQKTENKYQLSSLTKFLFNKEGFIALLEGEKIPKELYNNPCLGLKAGVQNNSGLLSTKVKIALLDCRNTEIFTTVEGKSKEKDFKKAFHQSVRRAFESVKALNYAYDRRAVIKTKVALTEDDPIIEEVIEEPSPEIISERKVVKNIKEPIVVVEEVVEESSGQAIVKDVVVSEEVVSAVEVLYAQSKPYGFQLVDSTPKVTYILQKSSIDELFILKNKSGILHKKNGKWIAEYYENGSLVQKELTIKF